VSDDDMEQLLTVQQVADWWQVSKDWVYDCVQQNRIPYTRIGGRKLRFRKAEMVAYLEQMDGGIDVFVETD
jgi:excisionase family DNA binding protein